MNEIRNTAADMFTPGSPDPLLALASGMATGSATEFIQGQERAGQSQLLRSELLPTDTHGTDAEFQAVGFVFGEPVQGDPMFRKATLPEGWSKVGSSHDMWSHVIDGLGRKRVSVFYKAAWYDRAAHMGLVSVGGYVRECVAEHRQLLTDGEWATPAAVVAACRGAIEGVRESAGVWRRSLAAGRDDDYARERLAECAAEELEYAALAEKFAVVAE